MKLTENHVQAGFRLDKSVEILPKQWSWRRKQSYTTNYNSFILKKSITINVV